MRAAMVLGIGACLLLISGCTSKVTHKSGAQEFLKLSGEMNDILLTVKDKATAEAARPKMKNLAERIKTLGKQMQELGEPSAADNEWMQKEFIPSLQSQGMKSLQTLMAISDPEAKKIANEMIKEFTESTVGSMRKPTK